MIAPSLETKVAQLRRPELYPDKPGHIDVVETHMSWVFMTGRNVYKLKKPMRYDFLDFSTLALRQYYCEEEVRLNRRLAPEVYLGTVPLTMDAAAQIHLGGDGDVIDWLVHMRRLPAQCMLDNRIRQGVAAETDIRQIASTLARFYRQCAAVEVSHAHYRQQLEQSIELNKRELLGTEYPLPQALIRNVHAEQENFLTQQAAVFDARIDAGRIIEGHGDLRPEHICLQAEPVIIDCLEFNRQFRIIDPVDELAFLAMECEFLGAWFVDRELFRTYGDMTGDHPPVHLVLFYKSYRACMRARLSIWHVRELEKRDWGKWQQRATDYLHLAEIYCNQLAQA